MGEVIYNTPNMMTMARNTQGEREERIVEIYATSESLRDQHQDYVGTEESSNTLGTVRSQQPDPVSRPRCPIRAVVVLLVLLSVALLAGLLGLAVQHKTVMEKTVSMDRDTEQLLQRLKNVTEQRDSLLCKQDCPGGWDKFGCKCYRLSNEWESWNKSREICVSVGADLVVVDNEGEMNFISGKGSCFWLGATDEASEGLWRWVDGTVLSVDNPSWVRRKPGDGKDKNCLRRDWVQTNFKWEDESCEARNYGLCEYNLRK
ncbi:C-type lectin domain family 6 member A-like [Gadus chalcogrammus]|uniref:C-type lectin domain family 6 member A-like n=1 Tax=Gadus chalcogrammus TaxID=1042646 RepID=UPI0024C4924D|nr:C-type lectin domain family 6 member A-like [Gadus chalcogrammus]